MSDETATGFGVSREGVVDLAHALSQAGATSLTDAFPAATLAPIWQALLDNDAIETPEGVDAARIEVRLTEPRMLELHVPFHAGDDEQARVLPVPVEGLSVSGELADQLGQEAERLAEALELSQSASASDVAPEPGKTTQKPHN